MKRESAKRTAAQSHGAVRTELGLQLERAALDILAHVRGEKKLPSRTVVLPDPVDVRKIREESKMSQNEFARAFCINPRSLQDWEQGRRKPDSTSRAYLSVIARDAKSVMRALGTGKGT